MPTISQAGAMAPSSQRPVPLSRRQDLRCENISYQQAGSWVIKDPITLKYVRLQPEQYLVLNLLDGKRSLEEIREAYRKEFPAHPLTLEEIQNLVTDLHRSGLVVSERFNQGAALVERRREEKMKKVWSTLQNILYLRLPGWDPEWMLELIHPFFRWMYSPFGVAFWCVVVFSSWILLFAEFDTFRQRLPGFQQFFGWPNLMYLWIVLGCAKIIHEFGHGLSCKHFGGECHEMGMMLLVLSPCLYCDVTDSWLLHNKWHRIMIGAAGMYIEVLLAAFAIYGWWFSEPGLFNYLCLNLFFVSTVTTVIFNANPLMRYDGYYMLSDFLEIPNLRPKADKLLKEWFSWYCLGIESKPDPFMPQRGQVWFVLFAIAANIYRWVVMFAILLFFYTFLKPYGLQSIGVAMMVFSIASIVFFLGQATYKIISTPRRDPMSKVKIGISLTILGALVAAAMLIPFPWSIESALVIEPQGVQHVYVKTPGKAELVDELVWPGKTVRQGELLALLSNTDKEEELRQVQVEVEVQRKEIDTQHALANWGAEKLAKAKLQTLQERQADLEDQVEQLELRAPCDGTVVEPSRTEASRLEDRDQRLPTWHGTPLDPRNRQAFLQMGTPVLSIAPNEKFQAVLLVDQGDRNDIHDHTEIRLKLDHLPHRVYYGKVAEVSERPVEFAPKALSNKAGGDLATVTDNQGREKLESIAYQATVIIDQDNEMMKSGLKGRAKFIVARRSAWDWTWRYLRRTFHFRL